MYVVKFLTQIKLNWLECQCSVATCNHFAANCKELCNNFSVGKMNKVFATIILWTDSFEQPLLKRFEVKQKSDFSA